MNPLLSKPFTLPLFDEILADHVMDAVSTLKTEVENGFLEVENNLSQPTWENTIEKLNLLEDWFTRVWAPISHLNMVKNSPELREAYQAAQPIIVALGLKLSQSEKIYTKLKSIKDSDQWNHLDQSQKRSIDGRIISAELSGINLSGEKKQRFNKIAEELSRLSTDFSNNVLDATKAFKLVVTHSEEIEGLSDSAKEMLAYAYADHSKENQEKIDGSKGPWLVTLDGPVYIAIMQNAKNRNLREKIYRNFIARASSGEKDNTPLMDQILALRHEKAQLLGYKNFAEVSLAQKMARSVDEIYGLLESLLSSSLEPAQAELKEITELAQSQGHSGSLAHWDVSYWAKRLEETKFGYTDEQLRPYFSLEKVLNGMFELVNKIFGIKVTKSLGEARVWHKDVGFFKVLDENGLHIASFFLDPYSRSENKRGGAWMDEVVGRRTLANELRIPVAHLVCNFTPPVGDKPSLLTFDEVETMFHEFGHGLQHMLTKIGFSDVAGISGVEWDAVELPSQFMENWCYHEETLLGMAKHYQTGEPLPREIFLKIKEARSFRAGMIMLRQLNFALTDLALHTHAQPDVKKLEAQVSARTAVLEPLPEDRFLCSFTHIFAGGYAAGYYGYKWAEVLSADAFEAFEDVGLDNPQALAKVGQRFKDTVLALGGSVHPAEVFKLFRGRDPSPNALLRHNGLLRV